MTENILKLAAFTHELVGLLQGAAIEDFHVEKLLPSSDRASIASALQEMSPDELDALALNALGLLSASENELLQNALADALSLVNEADRQHTSVVEVAEIAFELTALGAAAAVAIILACRIGSVKIRGFEIKFFKGVPTAAERIIKSVAQSSKPIEKLVAAIDNNSIARPQEDQA